MQDLRLLTLILFTSFTFMSCGKTGALKITCPDCSSNLVTETDFVDDDNTILGFGGGNTQNTSYSSNALTLSPVENISELDESWAPQYASLEAYFKLDEAAASANISSQIGAYTGTPSGAEVTLGVAGKIGSAASFDATSSAVITLNNLPAATDKLTVSAWVYYTTGGTVSFPKIIHAHFTANTGYFIGLDNVTTSRRFAAYRKNATYNTSAYTGDSAINSTGWHHVVAVFDDNTIQRYVNGRLILDGVDGNADGVFPETNEYYIAAQSPGAWHFHGAIDELAIWSAALTAQEIENIYFRQAPSFVGTFESRIMDAYSPSTWRGIDWLTSLPYAKELVDGTGPAISESSDDYSELVGSTGNLDDNDLQDQLAAYWRFNETAANLAPGGTDLEDFSGNERHCTNSANVFFDYPGRFGRAVSFDATGNFTCSITASPGDRIDFSGDFTISMWIQTSAETTTHRHLIGLGGGAPNWGLYLVFGTGRLRFNASDGVGIHDSVTSNLNNGEWRHIILRREGTTYDFYIDGVRDTHVWGALPAPDLTLPNAILVGDYFGGEFLGQIDEVAIWTRALDPTEVVQLYQRGANILKFQVRSCALSDCSDQSLDSWQGPDGTNQSYFSEVLNYDSFTALGVGNGSVLSSSPTVRFSDFTSAGSSVSDNQYFQYRVIFESFDKNTVCNTGVQTCVPQLETVIAVP